jgi:ABC-type amino acid transport system permease subunit
MHGYVFQFRPIFQELPLLLSGALVTIHISILTLFFSFIVGTIGALCRSAVLGKPFAVSEYNHPAPNDAQAECVPLVAEIGRAPV